MADVSKAHGDQSAWYEEVYNIVPTESIIMLRTEPIHVGHEKLTDEKIRLSSKFPESHKIWPSVVPNSPLTDSPLEFSQLQVRGQSSQSSALCCLQCLNEFFVNSFLCLFKCRLWLRNIIIDIFFIFVSLDGVQVFTNVPQKKKKTQVSLCEKINK